MPAATRSTLQALKAAQAADKLRLGASYGGLGTVFCNPAGRPMSRQVIHAQFRDVTERAGLGRTWQPRECRHTFVSVMSDAGEDIESISAAVGHKNSAITKTVYRHVIADRLTRAATAMDRINLAAGGTQ